jgi:hypothetical protein
MGHFIHGDADKIKSNAEKFFGLESGDRLIYLGYEPGVIEKIDEIPTLFRKFLGWSSCIHAI